MTRLLTASFVFLAFVFLFSCNNKPKDSVAAEKMLSPGPGQNSTVDARLYLLYSDISKDSNDLQKLVNSGIGADKLVFQNYFKQNGQLVLVAYSGKNNNYDSYVPVIDAIPISDTGINYDTFSGTNFAIGNMELTNSPGNRSFDSLKNYLNHPHAENYLIFVPHPEWIDSVANKKILTYLVVGAKTLPANKAEYEAYLQTPPPPPGNKLSLPRPGGINPCPPRCP